VPSWAGTTRRVALHRQLQFGVSTAAFFPRPLSETLALLARQPWKGVEFMPQTPEECHPDFANTLLELGAGRFEFCGMHFPQILAPFLYNPYPGAVEYGRRLCINLGDLAGQLGVSTVVVHGPWDKMAGGAFLEASVENIRLLCETAEPHDVWIALENTPGSPLGRSPEALVEFAGLIDRPNVSFTLDITHAYQLEQDPMIYVEGLPDIAHVHVSDFSLAKKQQHVAPGEGDVNWQQIVSALRARGFAGNFIIELLPETLGPDPAETLRKSAALLTPLFDWQSGLKGLSAQS